MEKKNLEKLYEKFMDELEPTEEMIEAYNELADKIVEIKNVIPEEKKGAFDDLESLFSKSNFLENKQAFIYGFSLATKLIFEAKDE